ncbi:MAG: glycosyltransferase family 4 protein [Ignavibacteriaceae bacterium]|nr:glycosyltransferase family 4 protein [Ignavibacteriaceae bacterium]
MKILYSCLSKSWGGMEMVMLAMIKKLLEKGIWPELLCLSESRMHIEANNLGIIIHPIKSAGYFSPIAVLKAAGLLRRMRYDLIHSHASKDLWILVPALRLVKSASKLIFTKHVGSFVVKKDFFHRFLYERVNKALAISNAIAKNLNDTTPLKSDQIEIVYNGIDCAAFNPEKADRQKIRNEFKVSTEEVLIGMIGRFTPGKGHEEFLEMAKIISSGYNNVRFVIVGEASRGEDEYENEIKQMAGRLAGNKIIFTGFRRDIPDLLSAMDIFIFPSHAESFGVALVEAMAMELPSVCARAEGVLEIAKDGITSLFFEKKNAADLTEKVEILLKDPLKRSELGKAARKRVIEEFEMEKFINRTIEIYSNVINS